MPPEAKYACEVISNLKLSVYKNHITSSETLYYLNPGEKFAGYEIYVQKPEKVWMKTVDGWVTALWPNKAQASSGVGTTERVKYTEIGSPPPDDDTPPPSDDDTPPPSTGRKVISVLLTYDDGSTQEFLSPVGTDQFFSLHAFIESQPEAVFIKRTHVPAKADA